jgi:hypothetical protein
MAGGPDSTSGTSWERPWNHIDEAASTAQSTARADWSESAGLVPRDRLQVRAQILLIGVRLRRLVRAAAGWRPRRRELLRWLPRRRRQLNWDTPISELADRRVYNAVGFDPQHDGVVIDLADLAGRAGRTRRPARVVRRVHRAGGVRFEQARPDAPSMLELGLAGTVLVDHRPAPNADPLALVASRDAASLTDDRDRELHSILVRRAARRIVGCGPPTQTISVLLATNRPVHLEYTLRTIARQTVDTHEVLIGMHGPAWSDSDADLAREILGDAVSIGYFDESLPLGAVLAALTDRASGELITKWDDDDWYGVHHLEDLVGALEDSGADLVGKAAEFVRLESMDLTIRRFAQGAEQYSSTLAGGTLLLRTATLRDVGGWEAVPRHVDRRLIEAVRRSGGLVYRTHGFEYLLRRSGSGHTWSADDQYFLGQASDVLAGLDLAFCAVNDRAVEGVVDA